MFAVDMHGDGRSTHYVSNGEGWSLVEQFMAQLEPREYKIPETNLDE
jgi:hypothetical protein